MSRQDSLFSKALADFALTAWERCRRPLPDSLSRDEETLCRLILGTLPDCDAAVLPDEALLGYVRHGIYLRETSPFCREVPEDIFLHFVLYLRINSEDLTDCRRFFHDMLAPRVQGLAPGDAVLAVNRWCAEQVTYRASDDRTESPLTAYFSGIGRCGEESTFAVTALRSVGIPARQIYVPFWAHCDDNHAWVEAYADGQWYFLGACEPEPILNRGWFTDAASRMPLACYRRFFTFADTTADACIARQGCCGLYNVVDRYAPASDLTIRVTDAAGMPAAGVPVTVSVMNMARFCPVAEPVTDDSGLCRIRLGHVSVHLEARQNGHQAALDCTIAGDMTITLVPGAEEAGSVDFDCTVPAATPVNRTVLTPAQQEESSRTLAGCAAVRNARIDGYYRSEYGSLDADWQNILRLAAGNAGELYRLYTEGTDEERALYKAMLLSLPPKDYRDTPARVLQAHLRAALPLQDQPHFIDAILCPRLALEKLEDWRTPLAAAFTAGQQESFRREPHLLMAYLEEAFPGTDLRHYPTLDIPPLASLKMGRTDLRGRRLLFTAACRTLGIPARLDPADGCPEYWHGDRFHRLDESGDRLCSLTLTPADGAQLVCGVHFSLARSEKNGYVNLSLPDTAAPLTALLTPGRYRLITSNRLPNGSQLCTRTHLTLTEDTVLPLALREASPDQMLGSGLLEPFSLTRADGTRTSSRELLQGRTILIYLDVGKEPTEHILNEIIADAEALSSREDLKLLYVLRDPGELADPTLTKALKACPKAEVYYDSFTADAATLARKLFQEPGVWPLLALTDSTHRGFYGTCGYQVGTIPLTLRLADVMPV